MILILDVTCPHCGARGQVEFPPLGAMIIGPCPNCDEMVVIFCNKVLKLDTGIILNGDEEQKKLHLMSTLCDFLWPRVEKIIPLVAAENLEVLRDYTDEADSTPASQDSGEVADLQITDPPQISQEEVEQFAKSELDQIDDRDKFKKFFGK